MRYVKFILFILIIAHNADAADTCNALLQHGIAETIREQSTSKQSALIRKDICDSYSSYQSDVKSGSVKGSYGLASGGASYSGAQIESVGKLMCENNLSDSASSDVFTKSSSTISPAALDAWRTCQEQAKSGLIVNTDFGDNMNITIDVSYIQGAMGGNVPVFQGVTVTPENSFKCSGPMSRLKEGAKISNAVLTMSCARQVTKPVVDTNGRTVIFPSASINIATSAGGITRRVVAVFKDPPPMPQRLGEVVASFLGEGKFAQVYGPGWVLADGRAVPNTSYATEIANAVPDLRGIYLRGKNYSRDKTTGNSDGDLALGTFQAFQLVKHSHSTVQMIANDNVDGVDSCCIHSGEHHNEARQTGEYGGDEVRPNSVTVNFYIRVN